MTDATTTDVLVVGSGIAGCATALAAARRGADVLVVTKATRPEDAASDWAQGGIATTRGAPGDLKRDILDASAGTADPDAVDVLVEEAPAAVQDVLVDTLDVTFDTDGDGYDYAREAAHSDERVLHVDARTGRHVLRPFLAHLDARDGVEVVEDAAALELITHEGRVHGALVDRGGAEAAVEPVYAGATVLATGGVGALYSRSTNPADATGDGVAMAALAGADVADMEFVQFHPTAYVGSEALRASERSSAERSSANRSSGQSPREDGETAESDDAFLVSEAVRGEGGLLRNGDGDRFMPDYHEDAELAPRDVVARAVAAERDATGEVRLDVGPLDFRGEFPGLAEKCDDRGVDPADGIPVAPAEHFLCGGVAVDDRGRTTLDRLFAVGECARTGVHGANRLASTSLLEGLVWGLRAGETAAGRDPSASSGASATEGSPEPAPAAVEAPALLDRDPALPDGFARDKFHRLRRVMDDRVGLRRTPDGLGRAQAVLTRLKGEVDAYTRTRTARDLYELRNASVTALLIARAAAENDESVGTHYVECDESEATV